MLKYSYSLGVLLFCSTLETAIKGVANGKIRDAETLHSLKIRARDSIY